MRLTASERLLIEQRAAAANMTPSAFVAELARGGRIVTVQHETLAPPLMAELSRIGNNINQLARETNAGLSPPHREIMESMHALMTFLMRDEITRRRVEAFKSARGAADGSPTSRARDEFQGRVGLPVPR